LEISASYEALVRRLAAISEEDRPRVIHLSHDAATRFDAWQAEVEKWLGVGGLLYEFHD